MVETPVDEEVVSLRLPKKVLEFAEFYATLGSIDRDTLLGKILIEQLTELKRKMKELPHVSYKIWETW